MSPPPSPAPTSATQPLCVGEPEKSNLSNGSSLIRSHEDGGNTDTRIGESIVCFDPFLLSPAELSPKSLHGLGDGQFIFVRVQVVAGEKQVGAGARENETRASSMELSSRGESLPVSSV